MGTPKTSAIIPPAQPHERGELLDPPCRRGGAEGRGRGKEDLLPEHRRSCACGVPAARAHGRSGTSVAAQWRAWLRSVRRIARGARGSGRREHVARLARLRRSRVHDVGLVRRRSISSSPRWPIPATKCSYRCRRIRSTPRSCTRSARARCTTAPIRTTAGSRIRKRSAASSRRARRPSSPTTRTTRPAPRTRSRSAGSC